MEEIRIGADELEAGQKVLRCRRRVTITGVTPAGTRGERTFYTDHKQIPYFVLEVGETVVLAPDKRRGKKWTKIRRHEKVFSGTPALKHGVTIAELLGDHDGPFLENVESI